MRTCACQVRVSRASLGTTREVYLGKSIEGVLRRRQVRELQHIFRNGFVCIRRYRAADSRLLPLVRHPLLQPCVSRAATLCAQGCNPMCGRLQLPVSRDATLCAHHCYPMCPGLQAYVHRDATLCVKGCNPVCS